MDDNAVTRPGVTGQPRREARREEILNAARELFVTLGPERSTMRLIAQRLGQTTGALYAHFKDKESILRELCIHDFLALREAFRRIEGVEDPLDRLRQLGREYVGFALAYPNHYRLMFMEGHSPKLDTAEPGVLEPGNPDQDAYAFLRQHVAVAIEQGCFRPEFEDPDLVAQVLWSGVHGVVALQLTHADYPWVEWRPVELRAAVLVESLLRGLTREG